MRLPRPLSLFYGWGNVALGVALALYGLFSLVTGEAGRAVVLLVIGAMAAYGAWRLLGGQP